MILLDAYAVVAFAVDAPPADDVEPILLSGGAGISLINLAEAADVCGRIYGLREDDLREVLDPLVVTGHLVVLTPTEAIAWKASNLRIAYYERRRRAISLADCFLLASASEDDTIATADPAVAAVARSEQIGLIALPDSSGRRP